MSRLRRARTILRLLRRVRCVLKVAQQREEDERKEKRTTRHSTGAQDTDHLMSNRARVSVMLQLALTWTVAKAISARVLKVRARADIPFTAVHVKAFFFF